MFGTLAAGFAAIGYGGWLARRLKIQANWGERGLLGLFLLALAAIVVHFFFALSHPWIRLPILIAGCGLALIEFRKPTREQLFLLAATAIIALFCWLQPMNFEPTYDNGLYHLQSVRWNLDSPITPGLANLHGRLGFNTTLFLLEALIDIESLHWLVNYLTAVFVLMACAARVPSTLAIAALSAFFAFPRLVNWLGVLDADRMISALVVYCLLLIIEEETALLLLVATLAATVKLFAAPILAVAIWIIWRNNTYRNPASILAASTLALFGLRGLFLSGCAAYPAGFTCISSLPWAVLPIQARWDDLCVRAWGRNAGDPDFVKVMSSWDWFPRWSSEFVRDPQAHFALLGIAVGLIAAFVWRRKALLPAALCTAAAIAFWLWASPGIRYGQCFLIAAGILGFSALPWRRECATAIASAALLWALWKHPFHLQVPMPDVPAYQIEPAKGIGIWMPKSPERCWNHPVPCTPYLDEIEVHRIRWRIPVPVSKDPQHAPPKDWMVAPTYRLNPLTAE